MIGNDAVEAGMFSTNSYLRNLNSKTVGFRYASQAHRRVPALYAT